MSLEGMEAMYVKSEPEWEGEDTCRVSEVAARTQGGSLIDFEVKVEQDWENVSRACGVSEAAAKVALYKDHQVKDELVLGPVTLQPPDVVFSLQASLKQVKEREEAHETLLGRTCSVSLERMFVDTDHLTCHIGFQTYKLRLCPQSPVSLVQDGNKTNAMKSISRRQMGHQDVRTRQRTNKSQLPVKDSLKKGKAETAEEQEASVSSQNNSKTDAAAKKLYKCTHCSYTSVHKANVPIHERTHTGEKPYKCGYCSYASAHKSQLLVHERTHTGEKPYKCGYCSYAGTHKSQLLVHERIHTGEKPYKCTHCSYASARKADLLIHERTHTGEKPYKCGYCSYASAQKSQLLAHERIHTGEKRYKCTHCNYASVRKGYVLIHERTHTGEKPYKCGHCKYSSANKRSLRCHERVHTGAEPEHINNK